MDVLRVEEVRKSFRSGMSLVKREVLHGVSFQAGAGEIVGFLGPNGAGKTTTIKIILGLVKPDSGEVTVFDHQLGELRAMARIGYLPESPYFYPHLSLKEFLTFCGKLSGMGRGELSKRRSEVTELVGLGQYRDLRLGSFSKGMLQRAGLAQAILHDPYLLILDEPFSGLDPVGRIMVRDILIGLKKMNKTIFFSSHILPDMEALCDRTCIIREGVIVKCVGMDELFRLEGGKVEVTARGCSPDSVEALTDYVESGDLAGEEMVLEVKQQKFVRTVIQYLYNSGAEILKVVNKHSTLEEIFLNEVSRGLDERKAPEREEEFSSARP